MTEQERKVVIETLQKMISIPSIGPAEGDMAFYLKEIMTKMNFDHVEIDEVGNVLGKISGSAPTKAPLLFDGHIDTMGPSTTEWDFDPFGGEIHNNRLYGRGTSDMKGSLAAALCAAAFLKRDGFKPARDIYLCGSVSEELVEGAALEPVLRRLQPETVIIGEATNLNLATGQRGRAEITVETKGLPTHSSRPDLGINAIKLMQHILNRVDEIKLPEDKRLGRAILEVTDVKSFPYPGLSMVPDCCKATFDRRLLTQDTRERVLHSFQKIIEDLRRQVPGFEAEVLISRAKFNTHTGYKIDVEKYAPAWVQDNQELITKCLSSLSAVGIDAQATTYQFCTNGSYTAGKYEISTIGFGVGSEEEAHRVNESIAIQELVEGTKGYQALFKLLST